MTQWMKKGLGKGLGIVKSMMQHLNVEADLQDHTSLQELLVESLYSGEDTSKVIQELIDTDVPLKEKYRVLDVPQFIKLNNEVCGISLNFYILVYENYKLPFMCINMNRVGPKWDKCCTF